MKEYISIPSSSKAPRDYCYAFYKYDGSNLRFEWSKKKGFYKFGTRHQLFDRSHEVFGDAIDIFLNKYSEDLSRIFVDQYRNLESAISYCEYLGPNSFAGLHVKEEPKDIILFDVNIHKQGLMEPKLFLKVFSRIHTAELVYEGNLNDPFIDAVRNNKLSIDLNEGVICKGGSGHKLWMCKIKTLHYLEKLKVIKKDKWMEFWE